MIIHFYNNIKKPSVLIDSNTYLISSFFPAKILLQTFASKSAFRGLDSIPHATPPPDKSPPPAWIHGTNSYQNINKSDGQTDGNKIHTADKSNTLSKGNRIAKKQPMMSEMADSTSDSPTSCFKTNCPLRHR